MRDKLILLVGASGSGKTTLAHLLEDSGYNIIHSYCTREPREENEWGHIFVEKPTFDKFSEYMEFKHDSNKIAFADIYGEYYWATKDQYKGKGTTIYVINPEGAVECKKKLNGEDVDVVTIYLQCDWGGRGNRMMDDPNREVGDIVDRLRKDERMFRVVKCDYVIDGNQSKSNVLTTILDIIEDI